MGLLRPSDAVIPDRGALLDTAKARALSLVPGYVPPAPIALPVAGDPGVGAILSALEGQDDLSDTDLTVARKLAHILTGGTGTAATVTEAEMMALEVQTLAELVSWAPVRARIDHMLATGQRLRN